MAQVYQARKLTISVSFFLSAFIAASISAWVRTLAGGVWQGVDVPLAVDLSLGGCDVARTKPWKMLPRTLEEAGLDISGRCEKTWLRLFGRGDVCSLSCCFCNFANLLAASAASRSSVYCAWRVSTGNILAMDRCSLH